MSSSSFVIIACLSVVLIIHSIVKTMISISESISLVIKPYSFSHLIPRLIKLLCLVLANIPVQILLSLFVTKALFNNFSSLAVQHSLMSHFLESCSRIFIHLLTFRYFFSVWSDSSFSVLLEYFFHRSSIFSSCHCLAVLHHLETVTLIAISHT